MVYDYYKEKNRKHWKGKLTLAVIAAAVIICLATAARIYLQIQQLEEIGGYSSIYIKNLIYKAVSFAVTFVLVFTAVFISTGIASRNIRAFLKEKQLQYDNKKGINPGLPGLLISLASGLIGALIGKDAFYLNVLKYFNSTGFGTKDPLFSKDIGYYIFERPFLMAIYSLFSSLWLYIIFLTALFYIVILATKLGEARLEDLKNKLLLRHNLVNIALYFVIKAFSYKFMKEGVLYSNFWEVNGAGYVDVNIWLKYFAAAPFLIVAVAAAALFFVARGKLRTAIITIAVFPAVWLLTSVIAMGVQSLSVKPNELNAQSEYIKYNIQYTRSAYNIDGIQEYDFPAMEVLTPDIINRNTRTKDNIRVVDYQSTLVTDIQLQSNTNFYTFNDGDIINYTINGKNTPVFIAAREIDKSRLPDATYLNTTYKYTHGYGVVINPINSFDSSGQADFILRDLRLESTDPSLNVTQPRIYYGEMTNSQVIVNAANGLNEIDYDGNTETRYDGKGGIRLNFLNRLLFALKYGDMQMLISSYASDATLLPNRQIVDRAQMAVPFITIDNDPYILLTGDGRLKWVLDGYTTSSNYPYAQYYGSINYIRNSVKVVIDAYDGKVEYYVVDSADPVIKTYSRIYPGVFSTDPLPEGVMAHMRYPEFLFKVQTEMLKRYHLTPGEVSQFYTKQDLWDIAKYPSTGTGETVEDIDPYYNMIMLPGNIGDREELILMRPFTPSGELKHNMVSWLAVRNSGDHYGEMILFNFPKNTNIFGPYQVEVKINQIDQVSKDMTLWGQSGSDVYKGSLLVIPIENSILYVEPIYIRAAGNSSTPEVREIIVGYQNGDEFRYGIGTNLDLALNSLFGTNAQPPVNPTQPSVQQPGTGNAKLIGDIQKQFDQLKSQLNELEKLLNQLKGQ